MPLTTIGPRGYHNVAAAASASFAPQSDRAARITHISLDNVSASDTWVITCNGQELGRFLRRTTGNQQLLGRETDKYAKTNNIFDFLRDTGHGPLTYPVPQGSSFTISSVGGATANISLEYQEVSPQELSTTEVNHPLGNHKLLPVFAYRAAAITGAGEFQFDTEVKPSFIPSFFEDVNIPAGWVMRLIGLFVEAVGINTYSGAADHLSATSYLALYKNGQTMFTRDVAAGIPAVGKPAAAGSANTVYDSLITGLPPFQDQRPTDWDYFDPPLLVDTGQAWQWRLGVAGDFTGGADYSVATVVGILDVIQRGSAA